MIVTYEVVWRWHGDVERHRYADRRQALTVGMLDSRDSMDDVRAPLAWTARHRRYKRVTVTAISHDDVRQIIGIFEGGNPVPDGVED